MFGMSAFAGASFSEAVPAIVSIPSANGVSAAGQVGIVSRGATSFALVGRTATGSVGTLGRSRTVALSGNLAGGFVGTVSRGATSFALTGVGAFGLVGTVDYQRNFALTGVSAAGAVGTVSGGTVPLGLSGVQANGNAGNVFSVYWILINTS